MTSSLGYALLGLLARSAGTGYDLTRAMDRSVGHFWTARHSQVYPELARLETAGLVRHREVTGAGPRATKRYTLTDAGRRHLASWVTSDPGPHTDRDPVLLRISSMWLSHPAEAIGLLQGVRMASSDRLVAFEGLAAELENDAIPGRFDDPKFASAATVRWGIAYHRARIEWCDELIADIGDRSAG